MEITKSWPTGDEQNAADLALEMVLHYSNMTHDWGHANKQPCDGTYQSFSSPKGSQAQAFWDKAGKLTYIQVEAFSGERDVYRNK